MDETGLVMYAKFDRNFTKIHTTERTHLMRVSYWAVDENFVEEDKWRAEQQGFLPCVRMNEKPAIESDEELVYEMTRTATRIEKKYLKKKKDEALPADVRAPRKWTQLAIETALGASGKSVAMLHSALAEIELWSGYTAFRAYDIADYVEEFYPDATAWNSVLDALAVKFGTTRQELDAFIDTIEQNANEAK